MSGASMGLANHAGRMAAHEILINGSWFGAKLMCESISKTLRSRV